MSIRKEASKIVVLLLMCFSLGVSACGKSDSSSPKMTASGDSAKRRAAEEALNKQKKEAKSESKPQITSSVKTIKLSISDDIDYDYIMSGLKAYDDTDGDITDDIKQVSSDVKEHEPGKYSIKYEVTNSAGETTSFTLPVEIESKYSKEEEKQYFTLIRCINKITDSLKDPSSLNIYYMTVTVDGSAAHVVFSGSNSFGGSRIAEAIYIDDFGDFAINPYGSYDDTNIGVEITEDELDEFDKYYNPDSYRNRD